MIDERAVESQKLLLRNLRPDHPSRKDAEERGLIGNLKFKF